MDKRLQEIFSVERLRRTWDGVPDSGQPRGHGDPEATANRPDAGLPAVAEGCCQRLRATIERCFPPECAAAVEPLLLELEQLLHRRFPTEAPAGMPRSEIAKFTMAVDLHLNQIEDLLEAFEVGLGGSPAKHRKTEPPRA